MKIISKTTIKDLGGKDIPFGDSGKLFTIGDALSNILLDGKEGGKMKLFQLATKFYNEEDIEVDATDLALIKNVVKATEHYNALTLGQIELMLENLKEAQAKK